MSQHYRISVDAQINGRIHKAHIVVRGEGDKVVFDHKADLADMAERSKAARRIADRLQVEPDIVEKQLEQGWAEALNQREAARQSEAEKAAARQEASAPGSPDSPYFVEGGRVCRRKYTREGEEVIEPLCNFAARVVEEIVRDDGSGELRHQFVIAGILCGGVPLPRAEVSAADFGTMNWVLKHWGVRAIPNAGQGARDHLRAAIQQLSTGAARHLVYEHTGWRQVGENWYYLHAGGALGVDGLEPSLCVQLAGPLAHFQLPPPPTGDELAAAVRSSLELRRVGPARLMFPLLGAVYRAPLGAVDCSLHLVGHTGHGKSELAALAQQHYGAGMDRKKLPGSWIATANFLESLAFLAKDALLVIDDFKPGGGRGEIDQLHAKADRVFRAQGNSSGRGRCTADGSVRPARPPRGLVLSTGEDQPRGESCRARFLKLDVNQHDIPLPSLTPYQQAAAAGQYAMALAGYVRWLAAQRVEVAARLSQEHQELRGKIVAVGHPRTPGILADLALGLKYLLLFAVQVGAITREEKDALTWKSWRALLEAGQEQAAEVASQDPARRFLDLIAAAITSGRVHLANRQGGEPATAAAWGWYVQEYQASNNETYEHARPRGRLIGWLVGEDVYLDPESAYAEAQALAEGQGERLALSPRQLHKRLQERGLLASTEQGKLTTRRNLQGKERAVLHLRAAALSPLQESGESGDSGESTAGDREKPPVSSPDSGAAPEKPGAKTGGKTRSAASTPPNPPIPPIPAGGGDPRRNGTGEDWEEVEL